MSLASFAAVLSAACSTQPVRCEPDVIPANLLAVPEENQIEAILAIFEERSSRPERDAKPSDNN
jgi:hypothetical protein